MLTVHAWHAEAGLTDVAVSPAAAFALQDLMQCCVLLVSYCVHCCACCSSADHYAVSPSVYALQPDAVLPHHTVSTSVCVLQPDAVLPTTQFHLLCILCRPMQCCPLHSFSFCVCSPLHYTVLPCMCVLCRPMQCCTLARTAL